LLLEVFTADELDELVCQASGWPFGIHVLKVPELVAVAGDISGARLGAIDTQRLDLLTIDTVWTNEGGRNIADGPWGLRDDLADGIAVIFNKLPAGVRLLALHDVFEEGGPGA